MVKTEVGGFCGVQLAIATPAITTSICPPSTDRSSFEANKSLTSQEAAKEGVSSIANNERWSLTPGGLIEEARAIWTKNPSRTQTRKKKAQGNQPTVDLQTLLERMTGLL